MLEKRPTIEIKSTCRIENGGILLPILSELEKYFQIPKCSLISFTKCFRIEVSKIIGEFLRFIFHLCMPHKFWLKLEFHLLLFCRQVSILTMKICFKYVCIQFFHRIWFVKMPICKWNWIANWKKKFLSISSIGGWIMLVWNMPNIFGCFSNRFIYLALLYTRVFSTQPN